MVREAEEFASEDEAQQKHIEVLNSLSSFVFGLRAQLNDSETLGSKFSSEDKSTLAKVVKETGIGPMRMEVARLLKTGRRSYNVRVRLCW